MAEWIYEESFGEKRALLVENQRILAARLHWQTPICAGTIAVAKVTQRSKGAKRALCTTVLPEAGHEVDVPDMPTGVSEGSEVRLIIHREPMAERGRYKRAQGRYFGEKPPDNAIPCAEVLGIGDPVANLPLGSWEEVWSLANEGELHFNGGSLTVTPTPAMTLIDIDGTGSARELALVAIPAIAQAIRWLDLGGSIGIDFPSIEAKADRKAVDHAIAQALGNWPHERTAMNGFGFVQIVARLEVPSLLNRLTFSKTNACTRYILRQASLIKEPGALLLTCHPAVAANLREGWLIELAELSGRNPEAIRIETDPTLALEGGFAQAVPP